MITIMELIVNIFMNTSIDPLVHLALLFIINRYIKITKMNISLTASMILLQDSSKGLRIT